MQLLKSFVRLGVIMVSHDLINLLRILLTPVFLETF